MGHNQLTILLDNLSTAVLLLDNDLRLEYLNPAAEALLEISLQRYQGLELEAFVDPKGLVPEQLQEALQTHTPFTKRETVLTFGKLHSVTVDYSVTPINADENPALLIELQPLDRLLRISREKSLLTTVQNTKNLVRGLAHEIKNPLAGLRGAAQLLERQFDIPELKDYTHIIIEEADRLGALVDQLLGPRSAPKMELLNIHEVLERVFILANGEARGNIEIERDYDPSIPPIEGDKAQLIQAILNIVKNALQALGKQADGRITLSSRCQRQFTISQQRHKLLARIDIIDNGPGVPSALLDTLFLPMVTGRAEGSGLGLSISQTIIVQHQGLIECKSEPGNTVFTIYLPLEQNTCKA